MNNNNIPTLLQIQERWIEDIYLPYRKKINAANGEKISCPFLSEPVKEYEKAPHKIMIVGQELLEHSDNYEKWDDIHISKEWSKGFFRWQVFKDTAYSQYKYKRSPFWRFMRAFAIKSQDVALSDFYCMPIWTDLNKTSRCYLNNGKAAEKFSTDEDNKELNSSFLGGKSILQWEIECNKPDAVVFAVGNRSRYIISLQHSFGCEEVSLLPSIDKPIVPVKDVLHSDIPMFLTYHPAFLQRKKLFNDVVKEINTALGLV